VDSSPQLSPGGAIGVGLFVGALGIFVVLVGLGVVGELRPGDAPPWVVVCAGFVFVLAGLAVIVGWGVATGVTPDGDFAAGTPLGVRVAQATLGFGISSLLAVIATWVAFGAGPREFTATGSLGGATVSGAVGETNGRVVWGIAAVLMWAFTAVLTGVSVKRLRRARRV